MQVNQQIDVIRMNDTARRLGLATALGALAGYAALTTRWAYLHDGAAEHEVLMRLPGDDLIPDAALVATRGVTIEAPTEVVWPWLAQLGQGRGGFYSYDRLENLAGCRVESADHVVPEWQDVAVGDAFRLHPDLALRVAAVEPGHALVVDGRPAAGSPGPPYGFTWSFVLHRHPHHATRLLVRERYEYTHAWSAAVVEPLALVSAIMTHRMLRGIRDRAERDWQSQQSPSHTTESK